MSRGQFVAIYTSRSAEMSTVATVRELWQSTLVPTTGEPLHWPPYPDLGGNYVEYARYEPGYDAQFLEMCQHCASYYGHGTAVVPASASDKEAMDLFYQFDPILDRLMPVPLSERLKNSNRLIKPILLHNGWAYLIGMFSASIPVVVFLSDNHSDVGALLQPNVGQAPPVSKADWLYDHGVIEKW